MSVPVLPTMTTLPDRQQSAVYVDAAVHPWKGRMWCHLFCADLAHLHRFAAAIGLRRHWFQEPPVASWPHYDTTGERRKVALAHGAVAADRWCLLIVSRQAMLEWCRLNRPGAVAAQEHELATVMTRHSAHMARRQEILSAAARISAAS